MLSCELKAALEDEGRNRKLDKVNLRDREFEAHNGVYRRTT